MFIEKQGKLGVEFFFEKENLYSSDSTIDMILTMMAGLAEAESQQISSKYSLGHQVVQKMEKFISLHLDMISPKMKIRYSMKHKQQKLFRSVYKCFLKAKNKMKFLFI